MSGSAENIGTAERSPGLTHMCPGEIPPTDIAGWSWLSPPYPVRSPEMIWLIVLVLLLFAIGGGIFLSKFLFVLLVIALIVALLGRRSTA
jgi:hypothetical protein